MQYTQVKLLMCMMAHSVHLLAYTVHHVRLLIYMIGYADFLMANAVHPSEAPEVHPSVVPDVHDSISSTPAGKYNTPSEAPDAHDGCCILGGECGTNKCAS